MNSPNQEIGMLNPEIQAPELPPLNDLRIRLIMIPAFGIGIPHLTGFFGPLSATDLRYWAGHVWGLLIAFTIWHGNRFFLLKQRQYLDWFRHPVRKVTVLAFACVFYTAPVSVLMTLGWYRYAGFGPDWDVIRVVALACVICVAIITHVYETVYLIQQRETDLVAVERLERARTQAELDALRAQVAPHFLFNSLNTLSALIESRPSRALEFNQNLADVYRYILLSRRRDLVTLSEELAFVRQYIALLELRFEGGLDISIADPGPRERYVPPISLQVLVENAVKHNMQPLACRIEFMDDVVVVRNTKRLRAEAPSAGLGLRTLDDRCRLVLGRGIEIEDGPDEFCVSVPVRS